MIENKCCGNCLHFHPNSNIDDKTGVCKEYEVLVSYTRTACGWYYKKVGANV